MAVDPSAVPGRPDPSRMATPEDFGGQLTLAKERSGLTIRQIAQRSAVPASTVHDYLRGHHLPQSGNLDHLLAILAVLGEGDPARRAQWTEALHRVRRTPGRRSAAAVSPYRGLATFQTDDAAWFHGRQELAALIAERLAGSARAEAAPLLVVGASGAGKSSLLRAGAVPALRERGFETVLFTPGDHPLAALDAALGDSPASRRRVILVDQFEEIFAAEVSEAERRAFLQALSRAAAPDAGSRVAISLRADFYPQALHYAELVRAVQDNQIVVGAMTATQLRTAIIAPARLAGIDVDPSLVDVLMRDMAPGIRDGGAAHEAGALPLLSHALLATWRLSRGARLTTADYLASGGIHGAVAQTAEALFADLSPSAQETTRRLLLRLVRISQDAPDTRRAVPLAVLRGSGFSADELDEVLNLFVSQRLLTADADSVMLTHEALLDAWPRLRSWLATDRAGLLSWRRIGEAAEVWQEVGRDPHDLLRGGRLAMAREWGADPAHRADLTALEREFLDASIDRETIEQNAARRSTRRLRRFTAALTVLVVLTGFAAAYAFKQRAVANDQRNSAISRQTAIEANQLRTTDVALAAQLAVAAYRTDPTPEARASVLDAYLSPTVTRVLGTPGVMQAVAVTPSGKTMATCGANGSVQVWDLSSPGRPRLIAQPTGASRYTLFSVAFSPDGRTLAVAGGGGTVLLWNVSNPAHPTLDAPIPAGPSGTVYSVTFSPDGHTLAAGGADKSIWLWRIGGSDTARPGRPERITGLSGFVQAVAFSPDSRLLAAAGADASVRFWDLSNPARGPEPGAVLTGPASPMFAVAFAPDGSALAAGGKDGTTWLWHLGLPAGRTLVGQPLPGPTNWIHTLTFARGGRALAAGSSDGRIWIWDTSTRTLTSQLPMPAPVTGLAVLPDGRIAASSADGAARLWHLSSPTASAPGRIFSTAFAPHHLLFAGSESRTVSVWDITDPRDPRAVDTGISAPQEAAAFSGTLATSVKGNLLAVGSSDGSIRLWDIRDPAHPFLLPSTLTGLTSTVESIAFSPDGHTLAASANEGDIRLWDVSDPRHPRALPELTGPRNYVFSVAFSPDGRLLAAGSADDTVRLWNMTRPASPVPLGAPLKSHTSYVYSVAFSLDGRLLAAGSADDTVLLWNIVDPSKPTAVGPALSGPDNYVYCVAFSPDGRTVAATGGDGTVWLWGIGDPVQPVVLATLHGLGGSVYAAGFVPGTTELAAGGQPGDVAIWETDVEKVVAAFCSSTGSPITPQEWAKYLPDTPYRPPCPA